MPTMEVSPYMQQQNTFKDIVHQGVVHNILLLHPYTYRTFDLRPREIV